MIIIVVNDQELIKGEENEKHIVYNDCPNNKKKVAQIKTTYFKGTIHFEVEIGGKIYKCAVKGKTKNVFFR